MGVWCSIYRGDSRARALARRQVVSGAMSSAAAQGYEQARSVAEALTARARAAASDPQHPSPYIQEAARRGVVKPPLMGALMGWVPLGGKEDDVTVVAAVVVEAGVEWVRGDWQRAAAAAAEAALSRESCAVGDAVLEGRKVWIGAHEMDDSPSTRRAEAARAAAAVAMGQRPALFSAAEVEQMDAAELRRELTKLGLPASGKLEALRKRLAEVPG